MLNAKPQSKYFVSNIKLTLSSDSYQLLQLFLQGLEHVCLLMRRNTKNISNNCPLVPLAPDFYEYSRVNRLIRTKKTTQKNPIRTPLSRALSVHSNLKPTCHNHDNEKITTPTELRDVSELNATANNQEVSLSIGGKSSYIYGQSSETSSGYTHSNAQCGPLSRNISLYDSSKVFRQERDGVYHDHSLSSTQTEHNTLQQEGLLSSHEHNQIPHQERTTTNKLIQALTGTLQRGEQVPKAAPHQAIISRISADNPHSSFQQIYPHFLGQTTPRADIDIESRHIQQANAASMLSKSLHQHFLMRQNKHALTNIGMVGTVPLPALLVPGMYQDNALENVLNSSVYTQLPPYLRIQVGPGAAALNNFSCPTINTFYRSTSELVATSTPTLPAIIRSTGQRAAQKAVLGRTIAPAGIWTGSDRAYAIADPILSNQNQQTTQYHVPPKR